MTPQKSQRRKWLQRMAAGGAMVAASLAAVAKARADATPPITDEQVVASMRKGIDYLLAHKNGDNWQAGGDKTTENYGGETALVLYALLHAGESLQDDPEYHAKVSWRSKEIAPVVEFVSNLRTPFTYTSSLQALSLTLVPRREDEKWGEGTQPGLNWARNYIICGMAHQGGYTYGSSGGAIVPKGYDSVFAMWENYCASGGKNATLKKEVDDFFSSQRAGGGGWQWEMSQLMGELRGRKSVSKDSREIAKLDVMMQVLDKYAKAQTFDADYKRDLAGAKSAAAKATAATKESADTWVRYLQRYGDEIVDPPQGDLSNGQYAALGAWAIMDYGMEMPTSFWTTTDAYWRRMQWSDGSWPYDHGNSLKEGSRDTMGIAAIATLYNCQEFLDTELRLTPKPDKNLDAGLAWLHKAYKPGSVDLYYLYGAERIGLSSGAKFFGTTNWYTEGAATLVKMQKPDGSWAQWRGPGAIDTAYSLLFLARGRNPIVFNKLQYDGPWNARPRDDAYVTRWMSKHFEKPINWQVVNLQVSPDEWLDAPVLLITGSQDPKFTKDDVEKLRAFINAGGMIFSTADGGTKDGQAFTNAIKRYAGEVVDKKYEMRQLPKDHTLFSKEMGVDLPNPPPLLGTSNGVREVWIHSTQDVGADWQLRKFSSKNFELGAALYFYASGMGSLRSKLQPLTVPAGNTPVAHTLDLALLDYPGNSDPEPGAWPRMAKLAHANFKTQVNLKTVKFADLDARQFPLAHLTGTTHVTFTDADAKALKAYLDAGGLLFIDAAGGNAEFAASCEDLLKQVYPESTPAQLLPDHPIYTGSMPDGVKIDSVEFRKYGNLKLHRKVITPGLEAIISGGRVRILYSPWDICSGFLGTNTWGIVGYAPPSAETLGRNILLFAQSQNAAPAGK